MAETLSDSQRFGMSSVIEESSEGELGEGVFGVTPVLPEVIRLVRIVLLLLHLIKVRRVSWVANQWFIRRPAMKDQGKPKLTVPLLTLPHYISQW